MRLVLTPTKWKDSEHATHRKSSACMPFLLFTLTLTLVNKHYAVHYQKQRIARHCRTCSTTYFVIPTTALLITVHADCSSTTIVGCFTQVARVFAACPSDDPCGQWCSRCCWHSEAWKHNIIANHNLDLLMLTEMVEQQSQQSLDELVGHSKTAISGRWSDKFVTESRTVKLTTFTSQNVT